MIDKPKKTPFEISLEESKLLQELQQVHQIELEMQNNELRRANEELETQRMKLSSIYELAPVGYFILDGTGVIRDVNSVGCCLFKIDKGLILDKRFQNYVHKDNADKLYRFLHDILKRDGKKSTQLTFVTHENKTFTAQVEGIAFYSRYSNVVECYIALIDITERKEVFEKLEDTKERLELALEASDAGIWEYDFTTGKIYLDEAFYNLSDENKKDFSHDYHHFLDIIHPSDRHLVDEHIRVCIAQQKEVNIEFQMQAKDKTSFVSLRGHQIQTSDGNQRFLGTIMDISERRRLEEEAYLLKKEQQRKITTVIIDTEAKERKRISESLHDGVCQLLYGIKLNLQQLNDTDITEVPFSKMKNLLDLAIKETRDISFQLAPSILSDFGLPITIEEVCKRLSTEKLNIACTVRGFEKRLDLSLENSIFRITQELLNNAIKHSGATTISVNLKRRRAIEIVVKDNGIGFDAIHTSSSGTGLSSVKSKAALYNGNLHIDSKPNEGTYVKVTLTENYN